MEEKEILDRSSSTATAGTKLDRRIDIQPAEDEDGKGESTLHYTVICLWFNDLFIHCYLFIIFMCCLVFVLYIY